MKLQQLITALLITTPLTFMASAMADTPPSDELVNSYLTATKEQEIRSSEIDGLMTYYKNSNAYTSEQLETFKSYLDKTIGWDAIKPQVVTLIKKDYTATALQSMIDYLNTPSGALYNSQTIAFKRDYAPMVTEKSTQNQKTETTPITSSTPLKSNNLLVAKDVVEHNINGKTYFTGIVLNTSKKNLQNAQVEINLFKGDTFVDQYSTYITGAIMPDVPRYFKVSCGCEGTPATHDRIKTLISTSMY